MICRHCGTEYNKRHKIDGRRACPSCKLPDKDKCECVVCGATFFKSPSKVQVTCTWDCANKLRAKSKIKHGGYATRLYRIYNLMKARCDPNVTTGSKWYSDCGIAVCQEWIDSFEAFRDWALANGYTDILEIDRRKNELGYSPDNCRWVTRNQNSQNRRRFSTKKGSKYKGVQPIARTAKWQANARKDGEHFYLGSFATEEEAARAYDAWAITAYGEHACINFPAVKSAVDRKEREPAVV